MYIYDHPEKYKLFNVAAPPELDRPNIRLTVDTQEDFDLITAIYKQLYKPGTYFNLKQIIDFLDKHPELTGINAQIKQKPVRY